jgi:glycosyltransferase involved in cell wall biosynthesis
LAAGPTAITVHDLSFIRYPGAFRPLNRLYLTWIVRQCACRARQVITVSESTRQDVIAALGVPPNRVVAIPNGVTAEFCPAEETDVAEFRKRRGLPDRFIFFVGTLEPRKNLLRLVEAFAAWRSGKGNGPAVRLVVGGGKGWHYDAIFARVRELGLADEVLFPGFIPADELAWWYRAAALFVYPSIFEGFGLPVLEAMACGTPTITSTASSLPEVAGEAALLVDPQDVAGLAAAMDRLLGDANAARHFREAGLRRASQFSWRRTAAATADVYRFCLGDRREA